MVGASAVVLQDLVMVACLENDYLHLYSRDKIPDRKEIKYKYLTGLAHIVKILQKYI